MARLIDADVLIGKLSRMVDYCRENLKVNGLAALFEVLDAIMDCKEEAPTIDAVEVVRCKDCKYSCNPIPEEVGFVECLYCSDPRREPEEEMAIVGYDDFCSYGERKE